MIDAQQFLISLCKHKDADGKLKPIYLADTIKEEIQIIEEAIKYSQRWVGLTEEDKEEILSRKWWNFEDEFDLAGFLGLAESILREKNGG